MAISFSRTPEGDIISDHHLIAQVLTEALPYIDFLKSKTLVIKLGGSTLGTSEGSLAGCYLATCPRGLSCACAWWWPIY